MRSLSRVAGPIYAACVIAFLLLPAAIIVPASFSRISELEFPPTGFSLKWYRSFLDDPTWRTAIFNSLKVATGVTILAVCLGVAAALGLTRYRPFGRRVIWAAIMIPLAVPAVVVGIGLFVAALDLGVLGSLWTVIIAHTVIALPVVMLVVSAGLQQFDTTLEQAAYSLGASPWRTIRTVVIPAILPSVLVAAIFAFIVSWDEVVLATFLLNSSASSTLPVKMFGYVRDAVDPTPAAIASSLLLVTALFLGVALGLHGARSARRSRKRGVASLIEGDMPFASIVIAQQEQSSDPVR